LEEFGEFGEFEEFETSERHAPPLDLIDRIDCRYAEQCYHYVT
jgi:hypothetical protein